MVKAYLDVSLGKIKIKGSAGVSGPDKCNSYGLLHRIPAVRDTISDDQDLDEAEMFVPADANGIHGPPVSVTSALSVRRSNSNSHIATPGLTAEAEDADTTLNSHYLDPPIHSSTTPSPRSVAA